MNRGGFFDLYEYIAGMSYQDLPENIVKIAQLCLMDTIGIMVGATQIDIGKRLIGLHEVFGHSGGVVSLIGTAIKVPVLNGAFLNGSLAEVLEIQDGIRYGGIHPSSTVIPAVLALAQERRTSGKDVILAIVAGYEFLGRMTKSIYPQPLRKGFNMTGICGAFGAALACSRLLNFMAEQMANAIGICGMYSPISSRESFYHEIKPTHAGRASEAGLLGTLITERGIQSSKHVLETKAPGGICTSLIAECADFGQVRESLGSHYELEEVYFKPFPACRHTHGSIEATLELLKECDIHSNEISKVNVSTYDVAKQVAGDRRPNSESVYCWRQFSIPYVVSAALINKTFWIDEIFGSLAKDPILYDLMSRVEVSEDPELTKRYPEATPSKVEIIFKDGRRMSKLIEFPKGDPRNPLERKQLENKFSKLVSNVLGEKETENLMSKLSILETVDDISDLIAIIAPKNLLAA